MAPGQPGPAARAPRTAVRRADAARRDGRRFHGTPAAFLLSAAPRRFGSSAALSPGAEGRAVAPEWAQAGATGPLGAQNMFVIS